MAWFSPAYKYKKQLTIQSSKVVGSSDLSNFPVLISITDANLATTANGGYVTNISGFDIIFTDSTETTQLFHEIESYTASSGTLVFWVNVTTISHTSNTNIYVYFGNSSISTFQSTASSVWDSNYKAVYHMNDNAANTTVKDSTANAFNGTSQQNTSSLTTTGEISKALTFNGSTDYININSAASSIQTGNVTFSCWFKTTSTFNTSSANGLSMMCLSDAPSNNDIDLRLVKVDGKAHFTVYDGAVEQDALSTETSWTSGTWYYISGAFSTTTGEAQYRNGAADGTNANTTRGGTPYAAEFDIGRQWNGTNFNGAIDEVRVSNITRTAGWIGTEYNSQSSPSSFFTVGSLQTYHRIISDGYGGVFQ